MDREVMAEIKKLSDRVQHLEDKLTKQKRENANLLEALEASRTSGVSSSLVGQIDKKFSEIMQTEEKIQMTVADVSDKARKQYSKYEQTAQEIKTEVADLSGEVDTVAGDISEVTQTATDITSIVKKIFGAPKEITSPPGDDDDKSLIYKYTENGESKIYYYDENTEEWKSDADGVISSMFQQTAYGFVMNGNVKISGDQIVEGTITGTEIELGKNEFLDTIRLEMVGGTPRLAFYYSKGLLGYISSQDAGRVLFQSGGSSEIGFGGKVDFSVATVTGLYAVFE